MPDLWFYGGPKDGAIITLPDAPPTLRFPVAAPVSVTATTNKLVKPTEVLYVRTGRDGDGRFRYEWVSSWGKGGDW